MSFTFCCESSCDPNRAVSVGLWGTITYLLRNFWNGLLYANPALRTRMFSFRPRYSTWCLTLDSSQSCGLLVSLGLMHLYCVLKRSTTMSIDCNHLYDIECLCKTVLLPNIMRRAFHKSFNELVSLRFDLGTSSCGTCFGRIRCQDFGKQAAYEWTKTVGNSAIESFSKQFRKRNRENGIGKNMALVWLFL